MTSLTLFSLILFILFLSIWLIWRLLSQRHTLPCPSWLGWMVERDNPLFRNNRAENIINSLMLVPNMHILDFGCGPGRVSIPLAIRLKPLVGTLSVLDIQPAMLERVKSKAALNNLENLNYIDASSATFNLGLSLYDCVLLVTVLGEIPNQKDTLISIKDSLKFNGKIYITEVIADPHFQTQRHIQKLAETCGLEVESCSGNAVSFSIILRNIHRNKDNKLNKDLL